ncbi:MAG: PTS sugar transporter subunit IIB [Elusimicrobiota bacterium]|jgi:mannose/fructose/N-acetylgalactosamine-specific phosphotransferase system component IIB|nr:PTS sugar transporter subunit IIB [Elusimicrobiota bacterium]
MPIVLVRIDDRLVHGQIVQGWLKNINVDKIAVASDFIASDEMQKLLMSLAVPNTIELEIKTLEGIAEQLIANAYEKPRTMIIAAKPSEILFLINKGAKFQSVNVGGMHFAKNKKQILPNIFTDDEDIAILKEISQRGIELEGRILPMDERVDVVAHIKKMQTDK